MDDPGMRVWPAILAKREGEPPAEPLLSARREARLTWIEGVLHPNECAILPGMTLRDFQQLIERMYSAKDRRRGSAATFLWLSEEVGELAASLREGSAADKAEEFADVLAWLATLANVEGIDLAAAVADKYGSGCPGCGKMVCTCDEKP